MRTFKDPEWRRYSSVVNGIRMHYMLAGEGKPVVLLHGWPQTCYMWRKIIPSLVERYTVIAPDLRGYGLSDKPVSGYDKRTMAADVRSLVEELGYANASVVGHDRGARVAHRLGLDHPKVLDRLAVLDILPTRAVLRSMDLTGALGFWHWFFHLQPDLPELLVGGNIENYLTYLFDRWSYNRAGLEAAAVAEFVAAYRAPGALRAGFDDYRSVWTDLEHDDQSAAAGQRLEMPVLVLWGSHGLLRAARSVLDTWREYAPKAEGAEIERCGHFMAEEVPAAVAEHLARFLG